MDILVLLGSFTLLCALGVPVAYALGLGALIAAFYVEIPLEAVMLKISDGTDDFVLLAIPFFVLAGGIMAEGGMAARLVNLAKVFVGFIRGGLALVNILASTLFGCISGSSVADTASIGSVMIPQMVKQGYPRVFATNVTICGSVQALMIPPSHNAVIYSLAAGGTISVAHLFLAGIFPGLLFGLCLVGLVLWTAHRRKLPRSEPVPLKDIPRIVVEALWGLVTVIIIMGGILSGVFTPTESAAVACVYAFLVTFLVYRDYKWRDLPHLIHRVVKTVAMVMMLIGFSVGFGYMMALMQIPAKVTMFFLSISENKYVFKFVNTGKEPLMISDAKGSCGCTVPEYPKEPIAPGATGEIKVVYKPGAQQGSQTKTVTVTANTDPPQTLLNISADVQVDPSSAPMAAPTH